MNESVHPSFPEVSHFEPHDVSERTGMIGEEDGLGADQMLC